MPGIHAALSPSAAKRWVMCPPSARLNQKYKDAFGDQSSEYAAEGTLAHALSELKLRKEIGEINEFSFKVQKEALGEIPAEMDRYTDDYVDVVLTEYYTMKRADPSTQLLIEQRLEMNDWIPECFGTSDAVIVSDIGLIVIDLKYGKGVPVDAVGNYQARVYALGAYAMFHDLYAFSQVKEIIVQPRLQSVSEETINVDDLLVWADSEIVPAAQQAWRGEGEFHAGPHCQFCLVKAICRENVLTSLGVIQNMFDSPDTLSDKKVGELLPFLDRAEEWIKSVREYAYNQALQGKEWRGYKLVRGKRPGRVWKNEEEVIDQLSRAGYIEKQYMTEPKLRSVADLEKILKGAFDSIVGKYVYQGEGKLTLVPETDKREAYSPVELAFGDLFEETPNNERGTDNERDQKES